MSAGLRAGNSGDIYIQVDGVDKTKLDNTGLLTTVGGINAGGSISPTTTNAVDLGTASLRWRNIYTNDLQLSNGIGDYTIVEGEEDLFLYNNKTGKTFKFALIEVDRSIVPPKADA
jgi:hypothetical protein